MKQSKNYVSPAESFLVSSTSCLTTGAGECGSALAALDAKARVFWGENMLHDYSEVMTEIDKSIAILRKSLPNKEWHDSAAAFLHLMTWAGKGFDFTDAQLQMEKSNVVQADK